MVSPHYSHPMPTPLLEPCLSCSGIVGGRGATPHLSCVSFLHSVVSRYWYSDYPQSWLWHSWTDHLCTWCWPPLFGQFRNRVSDDVLLLVRASGADLLLSYIVKTVVKLMFSQTCTRLHHGSQACKLRGTLICVIFATWCTTCGWFGVFESDRQ